MLRIHRIVGLALLLALGCAHGSQGGGSDRPKYSLSMKFGEQMKPVGEYAQDKKWDKALAEIDRIAEHKNLNPYERASLWAARSGIHFVLNDLDATIKDLEQAVALDAMPNEQQLELEFNLGKAYFTAERFKEASDAFEKWLAKAKDPTAEQLYIAAATFAQANRFKEALPIAQRAVDKMTEPKEPWFKLIVSLNFELHDEAAVAVALERLVKAFPTKENTLQLAASYQELKQNDKALATLQDAYDKGMLDAEKDLLNLARFHLKSGTPQKGAQLLEQKMREGKVSKSGESLPLLAHLSIKAKDADRADAAVAQAGEGTLNGPLYLDLARLNIDRGKWDKARDALAAALQKGGLKSPGEAHLLLGVAHYNTKRKDAALAALGQAKKYSDAAKCADEWIKVVKAGKSGTSGGCGISAGM